MPHVIWIHPGRIFVQSHQEDVLLLIGRVECQHTHHDEVRKGGGVKNHIITGERKHAKTLRYATELLMKQNKYLLTS